MIEAEDVPEDELSGMQRAKMRFISVGRAVADGDLAAVQELSGQVVEGAVAFKPMPSLHKVLDALEAKAVDRRPKAPHCRACGDTGFVRADRRRLDRCACRATNPVMLRRRRMANLSRSSA